MFFAIEVYDQFYDGLFYVREVVELSNLQKAEEYATEMSREVIEDYRITEDAVIAYDIWKLTSEGINKRESELTTEFECDSESFLEKYQCREV